jgi:hypothetical protein
MDHLQEMQDMAFLSESNKLGMIDGSINIWIGMLMLDYYDTRAPLKTSNSCLCQLMANLSKFWILSCSRRNIIATDPSPFWWNILLQMDCVLYLVGGQRINA